MADEFEDRIEALEAEVAALRALLGSFITASLSARGGVAAATIDLANEYCRDADGSGYKLHARHMRALLDGLARLSEDFEQAGS